MWQEHKKLLISFLVLLVLLVGGAFILMHTKDNSVEETATLESIKTLIIGNKNCAQALPELATMISENAANAEAWNWQGVCQFQGGDLVSAKASFEKAISFDSNMLGAKSYLAAIKERSAPGVSVIESRTLTKNEFESQSGLKLDGSTLAFQNAEDRSGTGSYISATYVANSSTASQTLAYVKSSLKNSNISLVDDSKNTESKDGLVIAPTTPDLGDNKSQTVIKALAEKRSYYINVVKGDSTKVIIDYTESK